MPAFTPFPDVPASGIALLLFVYFASSLIRGMFGFGSGAPSVLFGALLLPPHDAVILAVLSAVVAQAILLPDGFRHGDWRVAWPLMLGVFTLTIFGVFVFASLKASWLNVVLGLLLSFAVVADMAKLMERYMERFDLRRMSVPIGLGSLAGLMGSIGGAGIGYFLSVYIKWATDSQLAFRGTNILVAAFSNAWRVGMFAVTGLLALRYVVDLAALMPAILLGNWLGGRYAGRIDAKRYFRLFQIILLGASALLIGKGLDALL